MHTVCGTVLRTSSTRIRNYADSGGETGTGRNFSTFTCSATAHSYGVRYNTATETTLTISGAPDSCNVPVDRFNVQFSLGMGLQPAAIIHNNLVGDEHHLFYHVGLPNQPTTDVDLCNKKVERPRFTFHSILAICISSYRPIPL
jgi:hypothetical protein